MKKIKRAFFKWKQFSKKQHQVMRWWRDDSPHKDKDVIICDGSVRAGKTVVMIFSFILWAMTSFNDKQFIIAGKTIGSLRRNVINPLKKILSSRKGFKVTEKRTDNLLLIEYKGHINEFYLFGGKDEGSQDLVQGLTAAGAFYDEVALMPESFVNQAQARLSVEGAKSWFNCNPAGPFHWFKKRFIDNVKELNALHIHFLMKDNLSLSKQVLQRYERMFTGVFYKRYILGLWVMSEGVIFDNFDKESMVIDLPDTTVYREAYISIDYGTQNPTVFELWRKPIGYDFWYCQDEFHHSGRETGKQKTDAEYADELDSFVANHNIKKGEIKIILDPSAASFRAELKKRGYIVKKAKNDVVDGIRHMMSCMNEGQMKWSSKCVESFKEFASYVWDEKAAEQGKDEPVKAFDHHCDAHRYFAYKVIKKRGGNVSIWK
ncbi:PBSX family phage terminase large subunit [Lactococcus petauri]|uniref:PBSX family phage terminase large subunit n=1 Tax=Lactococcus petauri TaxID=1940789 RepID=UPI003853424E